MPLGPSDDPYKHLGRRPPAFRPSFTLSLLYMAGFFVLFAVLLILPSLLEVLAEVPVGPEQEQAAYDIALARERVRKVRKLPQLSKPSRTRLAE